jgi:hypothetical protein
MALQKLSPQRLDTSAGIILTPASTPSAPVEGQMYYDSTSDQIQFYNGSTWGSMGGVEGIVDNSNATAITIGTDESVTLAGDLIVTGTTTTINSTSLFVEDKNIELGKVTTPTDTTADGGGIVLKGATDKTITWTDANDAWSFNQGIKFTDGTSSLSGSFLQETTTTIEGTISEQKLLMADSATLSGNLTVNDRLVLTQMQDDKYGLDAHVKLLIHSDTTDGSTTFTDSSRLGTHTITAVGNAQHKTTQKQFGATSMYFDGTGDYLTIPDHTDWDLGTGDFTIECWIYTNAGGGGAILNQSDSGAASDSSFIIWLGSGTVGIYITEDTGWDKSNINTTTVNDNTWHHLAGIRHGNNLEMYVDGVATSTTSVAGVDIPDSGRVFEVGAQAGTGPYTGYIDEIRVSKIARWTESFTPPYKAYQDSTPALLTGGYTITGSGTIENGLIDSTDQWEGSTYINTLGTVLEGKLTSGVKYPAGHVLQVKSMTDSVSATTGSTSYVATNTTLAITPSSSSSKILILVHSAIRGDGGSPVAKPQFVIYRGSTALSSYPMAAVMEGDQNGHNSQVSMNWLDSPNTTSSTTYTVYMRDFAGRWVRWASGYPDRTVASMTLMEIAG